MKCFRFRIPAVLAFLLLPVFVFAQQTINPQSQNSPPADTPQKFALVIGNGTYSGGLPQLANPVNDANDVAAALESLGFTVEKVLNGTLQQMEDATLRLKDYLGAAADTYGFFFYAGHGVQSGGDNYLIPVNADIPTESYLRTRAVSVQTLLDDLNDARNGLNVVVLDACRDNPFGWNRSTTRGLTIISRQPADSI
ncbi:MAG: caspase family protein, partial [Treponema sp.]|nr:caspase family protein [Treponema sp.]